MFYAIAGVLGACLFMTLAAITHMYNREVKGDPVFKARLLEGTPVDKSNVAPRV